MGLKCNNYIGICLCLRAEINWKQRALETSRFTGTRSEKSTGSSEVVITPSKQQPVPSAVPHGCSSRSPCVCSSAKPSPEPELNAARSCTVPPKPHRSCTSPLGSTASSPGALSCLFSLDKHLHKTQDLALKDTDEPFQLTHGKTARCAASHSRTLTYRDLVPYKHKEGLAHMAKQGSSKWAWKETNSLPLGHGGIKDDHNCTSLKSRGLLNKHCPAREKNPTQLLFYNAVAPYKKENYM